MPAICIWLPCTASGVDNPHFSKTKCAHTNLNFWVCLALRLSLRMLGRRHTGRVCNQMCSSVALHMLEHLLWGQCKGYNIHPLLRRWSSLDMLLVNARRTIIGSNYLHKVCLVIPAKICVWTIHKCLLINGVVVNQRGQKPPITPLMIQCWKCRLTTFTFAGTSKSLSRTAGHSPAWHKKTSQHGIPTAFCKYFKNWRHFRKINERTFETNNQV